MDLDKLTALTRPLVTLSLIWTLCYLVIKYAKPESIDIKDFMPLVMLVVVFWFKSREEEKRTADTLEQIKAARSYIPAHAHRVIDLGPDDEVKDFANKK